MEPIKGKSAELSDALQSIIGMCEDAHQRNPLSIYIAPEAGYARASVYDLEEERIVYELYTTDGCKWYETEEVR